MGGNTAAESRNENCSAVHPDAMLISELNRTDQESLFHFSLSFSGAANKKNEFENFKGPVVKKPTVKVDKVIIFIVYVGIAFTHYE